MVFLVVFFFFFFFVLFLFVPYSFFVLVEGMKDVGWGGNGRCRVVTARGISCRTRQRGGEVSRIVYRERERERES